MKWKNGRGTSSLPLYLLNKYTRYLAVNFFEMKRRKKFFLFLVSLRSFYLFKDSDSRENETHKKTIILM